MRVRALEKTYYAGRDRMPGDVYEMDDRQYTDIQILTVLGKIEVVGKAEPPKKAEEEAKPASDYSTKVLEPAAEPMTTEDNTLTPPKRQRYQRRDMRARK